MTSPAAPVPAAPGNGNAVPGPAPGGQPPAIQLIDICKRFGPVQANRNVNLTVGRGTIHGIVGENGAGKSTLMSILYGFYQADSGRILVNGRDCAIRDSADAIAAGIGMVHQHFMLVDRFTVLENVMLGAEGGRRLATGERHTRAELHRLERDYALEVDPDAVVGDLPVGLQQRVEILKALHRGAETLILDEPTGVLTPQEADHLFRILAMLRDQGRTVILITHKLREIMAITDAVTVMRRGSVVATVATAGTSREHLAELMVGRKVLLRVAKTPARPGAELLAVEHLTVTDAGGRPRLRDVSFTVRAGEIVGIAGVSGNGQSELLAAIAGIRPASAGRIRLQGREVRANSGPRLMRRLGLGHVPEDRQRDGLVTSFTAADCAILGDHDDPAFNGRLLLRRQAITARAQDLMARYDVRPADPELKAALFSGGNQQKIVLAREIERDPAVLLVGQPTRGVDIGAIEFIHRRLIELRDRGKAILLVSVELDEILSLADRILVMCGGAVVGQVDPATATERQLGLLMAGAQSDRPGDPAPSPGTRS